jgi:hypothetical protein
VSLLPRRVEVRAQPVVDHHSVRVKPIGHPVGSPRTGRPGNAAASSVALLT